MHSLHCAYLLFSARELQELEAATSATVERTATAAIPRFLVLSGPTSPVKHSNGHVNTCPRTAPGPENLSLHTTGQKNCPRTAPVESRQNSARGIVTSKYCVTVLLVHTGHEAEHLGPGVDRREHNARSTITRKNQHSRQTTVVDDDERG